MVDFRDNPANTLNMGIFLLALLGIGFLALLVWTVKETWNEPGIIGRLDEIKRLLKEDR